MSLKAIKPIKTEDDYEVALAAIDELMRGSSDTAERDRIEILVTLVEAYEAKHWPIAAPDSISAIEHVMETRDLRQKDLALLIGSHSHASEVLNRRRPLREYELVTTA